MKCGAKERCDPFLLALRDSCQLQQRALLLVFQAILAGDFILSAASMALARIGNITVVKVLSQVIEDLVRGTERHLKQKNTSSN